LTRKPGPGVISADLGRSLALASAACLPKVVGMIAMGMLLLACFLPSERCMAGATPVRGFERR
jgi:hypothetical protein